jgi:predicted nuclease of predicted toxin-antitoxin system
VLITKDSDYSDLIARFGTPPHIIWLRCGNTSNEMLRQILGKTLRNALDLFQSGEALVEISDVE